ncbi:beta-ketoacyl synthase, partial [Frankia sp. Cpl3]|nr:beta-ketoacyl synthase [Frankia sp. Cpl3]
AGLGVGDVDVVEGHGTGTRLGDPIEVGALQATYGQGRPADRPLLLGSLKSNIGHTQAAAGVAGVIKTVQALRHGTVPRSLHVDAPSSRIDWSAGAVSLVTEPVEWPEVGRPRRAGVSSFGVSGTNAHVILEQAPAEANPPIDAGAPTDDAAPAGGEAPGGAAEPVPWVLSAASPEALREQAGRLADFVALPSAPTPALTGRSLATTRAQLERRAVVVTPSAREGVPALRALEADAQHPQVVSEMSLPPVSTDRGPVFVFPGQGAQWVGMGAGLLGG